jgi:thioredoxin 1
MRPLSVVLRGYSAAPRVRARMAYAALAAGLLALIAAAPPHAGAAANQPEPPNVEAAFPGLSAGPLRPARLANLADGVILRAGTLEIREVQIAAEIAKAPEQLRSQLRTNEFFVLERLATRELLLREARAWAASTKRPQKPANDNDLIRSYTESAVPQQTVSDEELRQAYGAMEEALGGAPFDRVRDDVRTYVLEKKRQAAADAYVAAVGRRARIEVDRGWAEKQYRRAADNPVDKARRSGRPTLVDFGATGCRPCDMMAPILVSLRDKYARQANVVFIHVREEQVLAARYGVRTIPVQVFFDKDGKEVFRHEGFYPQAEIEARLAALGVKR